MSSAEPTEGSAGPVPGTGTGMGTGTGTVPFAQLLVVGAITGATAAAVTGVVDGLWTWGRLTQYLPGFLGKLRLLVYLAASHALVGLAVGTLAAAVAGFYLRVTRLGNLVRHAGAEHARTRAREPRDALVGLSLVIAFIPVVAALLYFGHGVLLKQLGTRKHPGLVLAVTMIATLGLTGVAVAISVALARLVEVALRAMANGPLARPLSSPLAPAIAGAVIVAIGGAVIIALSWKTLRLLKLRPFVVVIVAAALAAPAYALVARRAATRWRALPRRARVGATAGAPIAVFLLAALAGNASSVIKAAVAYSGGGDAITTALKRTFDFDRDGHAALFGRDDCNDLDGSVHPGATDIPDDGIDQNCVAGDVKLKRSVDEVGFVPVPASIPADWNVILVTIDTLRADHVGAYGYKRPTTPTLDTIAAEGAVFEAAWAHAPSTRYSMPALLTGRLPLDVFYDTSHHGWPGLLPRATTLAEVLKPQGFTTAAITNYWYFERSRRMDQGFDSYDNENQRLHQGSDPAHTKGSSSAQQTDKALAWLANNADKRFFLWVHYYDPHHEYEPHPGVTSFGSAPMDLYDQEILFTDQQLARLVEDLRRRGLWHKTVVVVTGDHGEGFGEHGILLHGYDLYAAQTKVPLIVRVPGLAPRRVRTAAGHVDVMPTLANLAGAPASTEMMGRSLLPWLAGGADDLERPVFQQLSYEGNHEKRGAATSRCHVLYNISPHTSWELYDVSRDPGETRDLSGAPGPCASTRAAFERWYDVAQIPAGAAEALLPARPEIAAPLEIDLGPEVRLLAIDMPAQVHPGETFDITWTFEARGRLDAGWRVFVHFENGSGGGRFTADHGPARPFEWWRRGQFIRYTITTTVPPSAQPGTYGLWTGLWKKQARRPVKAPATFTVTQDRVRAAQVEVVR